MHVAGTSDLKHWAAEVPRAAWLLAEKFWPGPLTMVLKRASRVSDLITGGQDTVGLRVPSHPVALRLLKAFGGGIAAPSANRFGRLSPTTAQHVRDELRDAVDLVLDGGSSEVGIESTIVDLTRDTPAVLRQAASPRSRSPMLCLRRSASRALDAPAYRDPWSPTTRPGCR